MIRRTFLRLAAAAMIHPAFNWTQPDRVLTWDFWVPDADGTQAVWVDVEWNFLVEERHRRRNGLVVYDVTPG